MVMFNRRFIFFLMMLSTSGTRLSAMQLELTAPLLIDSLPAELAKSVNEVWCNGENYTALCQGWPDLIDCYGQVMQSEVMSHKQVTGLYDYSTISIGEMLSGVSCQQDQEQASHAEGARMVLYYWLIPLISLLLIVGVLAISFVCARSYKKCGSFNILSTISTEKPEMMKTESSDEV